MQITHTTKLEDIHKVSSNYAHDDEPFENYDYDIHRCNQGQYEDYQNDSKSNDNKTKGTLVQEQG